MASGAFRPARPVANRRRPACRRHNRRLAVILRCQLGGERCQMITRHIDRRVISGSPGLRFAGGRTHHWSTARARRSTTASSAGRPRACGRTCFTPWPRPAGRRGTADRLLRGEGSSLRLGRKRMGRPVGEQFPRLNLSSLHQRIRSQGRTLAKMEIRASRAS